MLTSKSPGRIPTGGGWRLHVRDAAVSVSNRHTKTRSATTTYTRLSMTTPAWPKAKYCPTTKTSPALDFCTGRWPVRHLRRTRTTSAYGQRVGLPARHQPGLGVLSLAAQTPTHPSRSPPGHRHSGTLQPDHAHRMGLCRPWTSNSLRRRGLDQFLRRSNTQRGHSVLGGEPPVSRLAA